MSPTKPALRRPQSLRCVTHKACVASLTKPALRHPQSLRCVTHKACVVCEPLGRVSSPVRGGCLPRGGEGVSPEAGKGFSLVRGNGFLTSNSRSNKEFPGLYGLIVVAYFPGNSHFSLLLFGFPSLPHQSLGAVAIEKRKVS